MIHARSTVSESSPFTTAPRSCRAKSSLRWSARNRAWPHYHNNFQDPQAFLDGGGRRGRQYLPLTDGTYFINRWFATVELIPKTVVPIGYVGVVVSYYGKSGNDLSGEGFRHGERVTEGERGVWERPLRTGQIRLQHVCRPDLSGADDELRPALDHRQDGIAPLRREPAVDRPGHARRV